MKIASVAVRPHLLISELFTKALANSEGPGPTKEVILSLYRVILSDWKLKEPLSLLEYLLISLGPGPTSNT